MLIGLLWDDRGQFDAFATRGDVEAAVPDVRVRHVGGIGILVEEERSDCVLQLRRRGKEFCHFVSVYAKITK